MGMVVFDQNARLVAPLLPVGEPDTQEQLLRGLEQVDYRGQRTHSAQGIERGLYELRNGARSDASRAIVFFARRNGS